MKTAPVLVLLAGAVLAVAGWLIFGRREVAPESTATGDPIRQFCAACHVYPEPSSLPRSSWKEEIEKMYELAGLDKDLTGIPPIEQTLQRYLGEAPVRVAPPETYLGDPPGPLRFDASGQPRQESPGISYLAYVAFPGERKNLIASDMRTGEVLLQRLHEPGRPVEVLARLAHPCLLKVVDLDHDGRRDLLVAELGSFFPEDHDKGKVVWLRAKPDGGYDAVTLLDKVGRVADVSAADFDGDGDLDLIVAVFGWRQTGELLLMTNTGGRDAPRFDTKQLDPRVGAINVPVVDLDKDGRPDIIAVFSQHHESVVAFLNSGDGDGGFSKRTIYEAPHPDWGSSGIEVVDLDGDGDLDVVLVCGDTLDTGILHRHQGVYWLENEGTYPFRAHKLAGHVGAHKVRAADLDGDGDLDLAASSFLPQLRQPGRPRKRLDSVIWIEQTAPGEFSPHSLEAFRCDHAALEVADFDGDGDIDIAVGNFVPGPVPDGVNWWTLFDNAGRR